MDFKDDIHWSTLAWPLAPDQSDIDTYRSLLIPGSVLLLGCTTGLLPLSTAAIDLNPLSSVIIKRDWLDNTEYYTNILCDGGTSLSEQLCTGLVRMASKYTANFVIRSFNHRLPGMKYACHFPDENTFEQAPTQFIKKPLYSFYRWKFDV